jgi:hypothetical protein
MSVEAVRGAIFKGDVAGAITSSAELYSEAVQEALSSKGAMDKFEGIMMATFSPVMLPLVLSSAGIGAGICKVGEKIESKRSSRKPNSNG